MKHFSALYEIFCKQTKNSSNTENHKPERKQKVILKCKTKFKTQLINFGFMQRVSNWDIQPWDCLQRAAKGVIFKGKN